MHSEFRIKDTLYNKMISLRVEQFVCIIPIKKGCSENVRKISGIITIQILDIIIVRKMFQNVIVSEIRILSGICPNQFLSGNVILSCLVIKYDQDNYHL